MNRKMRRVALARYSASKSRTKTPRHYAKKRAAARKARKKAAKQRRAAA